MNNEKRIITPNRLTVLRIILACLVPVWLFHHTFFSRIMASVTYTAAGLTDIWDGRLARKGGLVTNSGKILDPLADKLLTLGTYTSFALLGLFPFWLLLPILLREVIITGFRFYFLKKGAVVQAEKSGKLKMVLQQISIFFIYIYLLERDYFSHFFCFWNEYISNVFVFNSYFFLVLATILTLTSGYSFFKKNRELIFEGK